MNRPVRVLVVEDERPSRNRLVALLQRQPGITLVESVASARGALDVISSAANTQAPIDIIFLDIRMPQIDGFEMLDDLYALPLVGSPIVIFTTAYDEFALRAFDARAIDYVLKPYSDERLVAALSRAMRIIRTGALASMVEKMQGLLENIDPQRQNYLDRLRVKQRSRIRLIDVCEIQWIAASGVYITIHTSDATYLQRETLSRLESQLDPNDFIRIHRSHIVNFAFVKELKQDTHGELEIILKTASPLKVGRLYRSKLEERIMRRLR